MVHRSLLSGRIFVRVDDLDKIDAIRVDRVICAIHSIVDRESEVLILTMFWSLIAVLISCVALIVQVGFHNGYESTMPVHAVNLVNVAFPFIVAVIVARMLSDGRKKRVSQNVFVILSCVAVSPRCNAMVEAAKAQSSYFTKQLTQMPVESLVTT